MSSGTNSEILAQNNAKIEELIELVKTKASGGNSGPNGEYNIETIIEADGRQTLNISDWDYNSGFYRVFANNTPAQISQVSTEIASNGYTSAQVAEIYGWNLGDAVPITLSSGEIIEMQIIGFNHDTLSSDHTSKAGITLQMKDCLVTLYSMNDSSTNAGGYASSIMKTSTLPTLKALLPQEWQDVIKLVDKNSANGGNTNYSKTLTLSEDLFLLSMIEVDSDSAPSFAEDARNEGARYEYFVGKGSAARIKNKDSDADGVADKALYWALRSAGGAKTNLFCSFDDKGAPGATDAKILLGVSFAFCV